MASNDRILVSVPEMEDAINKYENARNTLQDSFSKLETAKDILDTCYKGPAYQALSIKWKINYANVRTAENAIDAAVKGLRATIEQMSDRESAVKSTASNLDTGSAVPVYQSSL